MATLDKSRPFGTITGSIEIDARYEQDGKLFNVNGDEVFFPGQEPVNETLVPPAPESDLAGDPVDTAVVDTGVGAGVDPVVIGDADPVEPEVPVFEAPEPVFEAPEPVFEAPEPVAPKTKARKPKSVEDVI